MFPKKSFFCYEHKFPPPHIEFQINYLFLISLFKFANGGSAKIADKYAWDPKVR